MQELEGAAVWPGCWPPHCVSATKQINDPEKHPTVHGETQAPRLQKKKIVFVVLALKILTLSILKLGLSVLKGGFGVGFNGN